MRAAAASGVDAMSRIHPRTMAPSELAAIILAREEPAGIVLDHDGTLVRFMADPALALPSARVIRDLARLLGKGWPVCVISGRSLGFLLEAFPITGIDLVGSHGAEMAVGGRRKPTVPRRDPAVIRLAKRLRRDLRDAPGGLFLETKPFGVAVHVRAMPATMRSRWMRRASDILEGALPDGFEALAGSCVVEARRPGIDKGRALMSLRGSGKRWERALVAAGDDTTDEDMFEVLSPGDTGILVAGSPRPSAAGYRLRSPGEVLRFLESLIDAKEK